MTSYGDAIRKKRMRKNISQVKLAEMVKCSPKTICRIENGGDCTVNALMRLLDALNLDLKVVDNEKSIYF